MWATFGLLAEMVAEGPSGSVVTLLADSGDRYQDTYFSAEWVSAQGLDQTSPADALLEFERSCVLNRDTAIWPADGPVR